MDDGVVAGTGNAVARVIAIIKVGLFINDSKCKILNKGNLNSFPLKMKGSNLELLGASILAITVVPSLDVNLPLKPDELQLLSSSGLELIPSRVPAASTVLTTS